MHEETSHPKGGISFQPIDTSLKRYSIPDVKLPSLSQQEFRLPYNKVQTIPASYDYSQHCSVIYWDEVHDICRDAQYLLDGETIVPFMTDDNFDYVMPLRVAYRPGTVFEVVTGTHIAVDEVATTMDNVLDPSGKRHSNFDFSADNSKDDSDEEYEEYSDTPSPMSDTPCSTNPVSLAMGKWRRRVAHYSNNATFTKSYYCHCPSCDRRFVSSDALMGIHVESVPPSIHNDCCVDSCDKRFADGKTFDRHQDTDHSYNEHQSFDKAVEKHSVPEKPSISALSLLPKPTLFTRYSLETRINSVVFREYRLHELSSPRLFILLPEKINNGDSGYGGIDGQPESPGAGLGIGPESMMGNGHGHGKGDQGSMVYSSSAPSPSTRPKRRSEVFAHQESPYFYPAQQHFNLFSADQSMSYNLKIAAKIDRGFFLAANDWTCYRRNYFQLSASFSILGLNTSIHPEVPCLLERSGELLSVRAFLICIGARMQNGEKVIELVQHTPKRDKGPQITPQPTHVRAGGDLSINSSGSNPNVITFERVQFKTATANNGKRRAAQQYYQVHVDLFAEVDDGELILVADAFSAPLVVRGRSPGHYVDPDDVPVDSSAPHGAEARYRKSTHFRLFFLCGATVPKKEGSLWDRQAIHLSSDKGYQIRDADAFLEKYGAYALSMMEYVKYEYRNADANISPMNVHSMLHPISLNTQGERRIDFAGLKQCDLLAAVEEAIDFLRLRLKETSLKVPPATRDLGDDDYCETVDLRQLMSFLVHEHEEGVPGNLYRTISKTNGCVSWMCLDHHRQHYGEHEFNATKAIVEEQGGTFNEQLRRIQFTAQTHDSLTRIRRALQCTQDVHEISIRLEWPVYLPDLLRMPMAKDTRLVIDGRWLDGHQEIFSPPHFGNSSPSTCVELQGSSLVTALFTGRSFARVLTINTPPSINRSEENLNLRSVLLHSPELVELQLTAITLNATEVLDCVIETQAKLHCFRLLTLKTHEQDVASIFFNRCGNPEVLNIARIFIVFGPHYSAVGRTKFSDLFRQYGWCIESLDTNDTFVDHHATILAIPVKGAEYKLTSLVLNAVSLSAIGLGCLDVIIHRSRSLQRLSLVLEKLHDEEQFEKATFLLMRYGAQLTKVVLSGDTTAPWITKFVGRFSTACIWPKLRTFRIVCPLDWYDVCNIPEEWDAEIVDAPSPQTSKSLAVTNDIRGPHTRQKSSTEARAHTSDAADKDYKSRKAPTTALHPAYAATLEKSPTSASSPFTPVFGMDIKSIGDSGSMKPLYAEHMRRIGTDKVTCTSCGTTNSQVWFRGPSGKKDLCVDCGIRYSRSVPRLY
ncbi:hypothetical protein BGZ67_001207 [Mortierella alpina]|nr:hypothetical protein BGZ67_001207 [Mortierella alpina]